MGLALLPQLAVDSPLLDGQKLAVRPVTGAQTWRTHRPVMAPAFPRAADFHTIAPFFVPDSITQANSLL
ncbi:hypothetical protein RAA17_04615 [Komagataeibacter rhaeticus]|nr:hypothetical protein [Komagataeibacter rhaeticus]